MTKLGTARRDREREGVERWFRRRIDLRAHVAARDRVGPAVEQAPLGERRDIDLVEGAKAVLGERRRRTKLAGAQRRERPAGGADYGRDALEPLRQGYGIPEPDAADCVIGQRRDARRVLEHAGDEAVVARQEIDCRGHVAALIRVPGSPDGAKRNPGIPHSATLHAGYMTLPRIAVACHLLPFARREMVGAGAWQRPGRRAFGPIIRQTGARLGGPAEQGDW